MARPIAVVLLGLLVGSLATLQPSAQDRITPKVVVIFLDDFHISFRDTPRLRTAMKRIREQLATAGWSFAMVSDGPSSISIPLTNDAARLLSIENRIAGNGLTPEQLANPTPDIEREITRRDRIAQETLESVAKLFPNVAATVHLDAVLYITQRELPPTNLTIPVVFTRLEGIEAALAALTLPQ